LFTLALGLIIFLVFAYSRLVVLAPIFPRLSTGFAAASTLATAGIIWVIIERAVGSYVEPVGLNRIWAASPEPSKFLWRIRLGCWAPFVVEFLLLSIFSVVASA
jgi:hypothetical protein